MVIPLIGCISDPFFQSFYLLNYDLHLRIRRALTNKANHGNFDLDTITACFQIAMGYLVEVFNTNGINVVNMDTLIEEWRLYDNGTIT